jgi:23S rRNA (pseudouridine1915-N3)-methyltransferase
MKIKLIVIGKTNQSFLIAGETEYSNRLKHYIQLERIDISDVKNAKNLSHEQLKNAEGKLFLNKVDATDTLILLDDKGKEFTNLEFSSFLEKHQVHGRGTLTFIIGGAFGFSDELYIRSNHKLSLSKLTFSHQMIRMIFLEQLYRSFTIIKGESYHHE